MMDKLSNKELNMAKKYFDLSPTLERYRSGNPGLSEAALVDLIREKEPDLGFPKYGSWAQYKKFAKAAAGQLGMGEVKASRTNPFWEKHTVSEIVELVNVEGMTPREAILHLLGDEASSTPDTTVTSIRNTYIREAEKLGEYFPYPDSAILAIGRKINTAITLWNAKYGTKIPSLPDDKAKLIGEAKEFILDWDRSGGEVASSSPVTVKCPICGKDITYRQARQASGSYPRNAYNAIWCNECKSKFNKQR